MKPAKNKTKIKTEAETEAETETTAKQKIRAKNIIFATVLGVLSGTAMAAILDYAGFPLSATENIALLIAAVATFYLMRLYELRRRRKIMEAYERDCLYLIHKKGVKPDDLPPVPDLPKAHQEKFLQMLVSLPLIGGFAAIAVLLLPFLLLFGLFVAAPTVKNYFAGNIPGFSFILLLTALAVLYWVKALERFFGFTLYLPLIFFRLHGKWPARGIVLAAALVFLAVLFVPHEYDENSHLAQSADAQHNTVETAQVFTAPQPEPPAAPKTTPRQTPAKTVAKKDTDTENCKEFCFRRAGLAAALILHDDTVENSYIRIGHNTTEEDKIFDLNTNLNTFISHLPQIRGVCEKDLAEMRRHNTGSSGRDKKPENNPQLFPKTYRLLTTLENITGIQSRPGEEAGGYIISGGRGMPRAYKALSREHIDVTLSRILDQSYPQHDRKQYCAEMLHSPQFDTQRRQACADFEAVRQCVTGFREEVEIYHIRLGNYRYEKALDKMFEDTNMDIINWLVNTEDFSSFPAPDKKNNPPEAEGR